MAAPAGALLLDGGMGHLLKARGVGALPGLPALKYDELFLVGAVLRGGARGRQGFGGPGPHAGRRTRPAAAGCRPAHTLWQT